MAENYVNLYRQIITRYSRFRILNIARQARSIDLLNVSTYRRFKHAGLLPTNTTYASLAQKGTKRA